MRAIDALNVMKEGHDGSGVGLFLHGLDGPLGEMKDAPILSGIFTDTGLKRLDTYMDERGFFAKSTLVLDPKTKRPAGTPARGTYMARAYDVPAAIKALPQAERELTYMLMRVELRSMGVADEDIRVFSFWPDTVMVKEVGDPLTVGEYLGWTARALLPPHPGPGTSDTNYAINLIRLPSVFHQGVCTMTNVRTRLYPDQGIPRIEGVPGLCRLPVRLGSLHPHHAFHAQQVASGHRVLQAHHHAAVQRRDGRPHRPRAARAHQA
jgi:hypothetical protein